MAIDHLVQADLTHPRPTLIPVGDAEFACRTVGAGPPLLFLHGWPLHGLTFRQIVPRLAAHFTCHVLDFPGAGASVWAERTDFGMDAQARGVQRVADALGLAKYSIVSHDTGGTIARRLAILDASRIEKLIAIGTEIPHHRPPWIRLFQWLSYVPGADARFLGTLRSNATLDSSRGFGGCFLDRSLIHGDFYEHFVAPLIASPRARMGQQARLRGIDWRLLDSLATGHRAIRAKVLLLWGADDPVFPAARAERMVKQFADATFVSIPNARLFVHEERPDEVARACLDFLDPAGRP